MLTSREAIAALKERRLNIDCVRMELVQETRDNPHRYVGSGCICQDKEGVITFKMYANEVTNTSMIGHIQSVSVNRAGTLYGGSDFFTLTGIDYSGLAWGARNVLPEVEWSQPIPATSARFPCISGKIYVLLRSPLAYPSQSGHSLTMRFFNEIDIPTTHMSRTETTSGSREMSEMAQDYTEFFAANCHFYVRHLDGGIELEASSDTPFSPTFELRVEEALRFVLAYPVTWRVIINRGDGREQCRLSSERKASPNVALQRPLRCDRFEDIPSFWKLFGKYLEYVLENSDGSDWSKCSLHLNHALQASANSIDAWAIALCISIEGISSLVDWVEDPDSKARRVTVCRHVREWLGSTGWQDQALAMRVNGLLSMLGSPRVIDRLAHLVIQGKVSADHLRRWKALRNPGAHGSGPTFDGSDAKAAQALLDDIRKVSSLMYHLCFHLIGYEGPFTNYAITGWPTGTYPLLPPE